MKLRVRSLLPLALAFMSACGGATQASYLRDGDSGYAERQTADEDGDPSFDLEGTHFKADVCRGLDTTPAYGPASVAELVAFLEKQGYEVRGSVERRDLLYLDVSGNGSKDVRLRVATLDDSVQAGRDLHEAILEHGPGSWGVHRSNIAVLAPIGSVSQVVFFATRSKLACWGEVMMAGRDDTFVIAGGYREP